MSTNKDLLKIAQQQSAALLEERSEWEGLLNAVGTSAGEQVNALQRIADINLEYVPVVKTIHRLRELTAAESE